MRLIEDRQLYKGVFWIVDNDNLYNNRNYCFTIPCDNIGDTINNEYGTSKDGYTHNHKGLWSQLSSKLTHNKPFDYYPRGRVVITNGKATIWVNPNLYNEDVLDFIIDEFNLTEYNGINKVVMKADYSEHYKCYLDR